MAEAGLPQVVFYSLQGAPAKAPPEVVARINAEVVRALKVPEVQARITAEATEILAVGPAGFGSYIKTEITRFGKVIRAAGE